MTLTDLVSDLNPAFAVAGAGLSGLMAAEMLTRIYPGEQTVLIDPSFEVRNDRTWCYWTTGASPFPELVSKRWNNLTVSYNGRSLSSAGSGFRYECVTEGDFRRKFLHGLRGRSNLTFVKGLAQQILSEENSATVHMEGQTIRAGTVFNTALPVPAAKPAFTRLVQHFLGWEVETEKPVFASSAVTLMDFDVDQSNGFAFMYVLPFSEKAALVEITYFSKVRLETALYEQQLKRWLLEKLGLPDSGYAVTRVESGSIPMEDTVFKRHETERIINLGTIAGFVKPSTGYAFKQTVSRMRLLETSLTEKHPPGLSRQRNRFALFDAVLLRVLAENPTIGPGAFFKLFERVGFNKMLRFLDEESVASELVSIALTVPTLPFSKALLQILAARVRT